MKLAKERIRIYAYVFSLAVLCLISTARFACESPQARPLGENSFDQYLHRFDELKKVLPARGAVGYIDDRAENPLGPGYYYAVQYAAAPLVVKHSVDPDLVIGNFTSSAAASAHPTNLVTVRDFGQGVVLFRQRHP
jgi:hypothetical protein